MEQQRGMVTVLGYFPTSGQAQKAQEALAQIGVEVLQVDRVSRYGTSFDANRNNAIADRADTQTGLTLFSENQDNLVDRDTRILRGADPSNYSLADGGYGMAGGKAFLLTAVTEDDKVEEVVRIMKTEGGTV